MDINTVCIALHKIPENFQCTGKAIIPRAIWHKKVTHNGKDPPYVACRVKESLATGL